MYLEFLVNILKQIKDESLIQMVNVGYLHACKLLKTVFRNNDKIYIHSFIDLRMLLVFLQPILARAYVRLLLLMPNLVQ